MFEAKLKSDNLAAILNKLAYFSQAQPEMHVYLKFYVFTHHKDSKKPMSLMSIPDGTLLYLKPVYITTICLILNMLYGDVALCILYFLRINDFRWAIIYCYIYVGCNFYNDSLLHKFNSRPYFMHRDFNDRSLITDVPEC